MFITITFEALKFLLSFCAVLDFANSCYKNILSSLLCYFSSSELMITTSKKNFPKIAQLTWKKFQIGRKIRLIHFHKQSNRNAIAITETQLQQTAALRLSSSALPFTGKSIFHFSKICNINKDLEPTYSCCLVLHSCCVVLYPCCLVLYLCCLMLYLCCLVLYLCCLILYLCCLVLYSSCVVLYSC